MTSGTLPPIESVSGGSHGVQAGYEQMLALAERYERQAGDFVEMAGLGARIMANGDLLESSILSPGSFADAELQVLDATTGANGLTVRAIGIEADALGVRAVVAAFKASDSLSRHAMEMLDNALGKLLFVGTVAALPALLAAGGISYAYYSTLSPEEQEALKAQLAENLGQFLHDHPEVAQHLINGGGGLLESLVPGLGLLNPGDGPIDQATTNDAARLLALLLGNDTDFDVNQLDGIDPSLNQSHAPRSLEDLMLSLNDTNLLDANEPRPARRDPDPAHRRERAGAVHRLHPRHRRHGPDPAGRRARPRHGDQLPADRWHGLRLRPRHPAGHARRRPRGQGRHARGSLAGRHGLHLPGGRPGVHAALQRAARGHGRVADRPGPRPAGRHERHPLREPGRRRAAARRGGQPRPAQPDDGEVRRGLERRRPTTTTSCTTPTVRRPPTRRPTGRSRTRSGRCRRMATSAAERSRTCRPTRSPEDDHAASYDPGGAPVRPPADVGLHLVRRRECER